MIKHYRFALTGLAAAPYNVLPIQRRNDMVRTLYILTFTLLMGHQIDAAYWHEWDMFLLPGGVQLYDIFNLAVIPLLLLGFQAVVLRRASGYRYSLFAAGLGLLTFCIHAGFLLSGFDQFELPVSLAIIAGCGLSGLAQLLATLQAKAEFTLP